MRVLVCLLAFASTACAATRVALRAEARAAGGYVALADVADVSGDPLPPVWLGRAPAAGMKKRVTAGDVRVELKKAGVALRGVEVSGECLVGSGAEPERPGLEGFREVAARAIEAAADREMPGAKSACRVLEVTGAGDGVDFTRVTVAAVKPADGWWLGEARFHIYVNIGDADSAVWQARASVRGVRRAVVARRMLRAGHRVVSTDVTLGEVSALEDGALAAEGLAVGRVLGEDVAEGGMVRAGALRPGPIVFRGEEISVTSANARSAVRRIVTALEDGRQGDVIRVKNPDSKKEFRARITGPGAGEVEEE
ncbi:MAG: flagellar basal body P-ring formation protein FlgA [Planctomycetes bacterium]|nr:flagellar basal body P-ring formation protein FlgA [Planctomycetota bacterium]